MKRLRGGSGLGDSLYLRPIVDHLERSGETVTVMSDYPDVFIGTRAIVEPFSRTRIDITAHYTHGKQNPKTNQWEDVCESALLGPIALRFPWTVRNSLLIRSLKARVSGKNIILVHGGREPMGRRDGFGSELLPIKSAFVAAMRAQENSYFVRIGKAAEIYSLPSHLDLNGETTVSDLLDVASICDGVIAQCSFAVPLAEAFGRPLLAVWASKGLRSAVPFIRSISPTKILSASTSSFVVDDWKDEKISEVARGFRYVARGIEVH